MDHNKVDDVRQAYIMMSFMACCPDLKHIRRIDRSSRARTSESDFPLGDDMMSFQYGGEIL